MHHKLSAVRVITMPGGLVANIPCEFVNMLRARTPCFGWSKYSSNQPPQEQNAISRCTFLSLFRFTLTKTMLIDLSAAYFWTTCHKLASYTPYSSSSLPMMETKTVRTHYARPSSMNSKVLVKLGMTIHPNTSSVSF